MEKIELINLTLDEIRRAAQLIENVRSELVWSTYIKKQHTIDEIVTDCTEQLDRTRLNLREILEDIAEFMNDKDMLSAVDCALSEVSFDLIYERKKEEDFE